MCFVVLILFYILEFLNSFGPFNMLNYRQKTSALHFLWGMCTYIEGKIVCNLNALNKSIVLV